MNKPKKHGSRAKRPTLTKLHDLPPIFAPLWAEIQVLAAKRQLKVERVVAKSESMPGWAFYRVFIGPVGGGPLSCGGQARNANIRTIDGDRLEIDDIPAATRRYHRIRDAVCNYHVWAEGLSARQGAVGETYTANTDL